MIQKIIYLIIAIGVGFLFNTMSVPAGWLVGSLLTGIIYGVLVQRLNFDGKPFRMALAFVGANISLLLHEDALKEVHALILTLLLSIAIMISSGFLLGHLLQRKTPLDKKTVFLLHSGWCFRNHWIKWRV